MRKLRGISLYVKEKYNTQTRSKVAPSFIVDRHVKECIQDMYELHWSSPIEPTVFADQEQELFYLIQD